MKSDDVVGRVKTYEAIIKGENISDPGIPESFKVLLKGAAGTWHLMLLFLDEDGNEVTDDVRMLKRTITAKMSQPLIDGDARLCI